MKINNISLNKTIKNKSMSTYFILALTHFEQFHKNLVVKSTKECILN